MREYYSYRMPLNSPFERVKDFPNPHVHLGGFVKQSIQLANLHSHLIRKSSQRMGMSGANVSYTEREEFKLDFFRINGKEHQARGLRLLDPADKEAESEFLNIGCDLMPLSLGYEHMFDNYMTYISEDTPSFKIIQRTRSLVYNALF